MNAFAQLRRRCAARLQAIEIPVPFDIGLFCEAAAHKRGRPIELVPLKSESGPHGAWVSTPKTDIIFYQRATTRLHQEHIILHELSHLICEHAPMPLAAPDVAAALFPDVKPEIVKRLLLRSTYSTEEELEAELLASLIREHASERALPRRVAQDVQIAEPVARLAQSLGNGSS